MSLHLDARQRAMLQEMGVTVWAPAETPAPAPPPVADAVRAQQTATAPAAHPPAMAAADAGSQPAPRTARERAIPPGVAPGVQPPVPQGGSAPALVLHAPQALYPAADPAQTPAGLGAGWLVVAESLSPTEPLAGEAGRLLDNMLRAMRLHLHPRVFLAILERPPASAAAGAADVSVALEEAVATLRPAMVLVLGHVAARAALARTEPLGRLRAELHQLAGCPAIVTYDPAFLLRAQGNKAAAWADLCRALALVQATPASP
ncbi:MULTISPECIES: uracil-DNA glycosylase family protein [Acidovorax]|uniref:DNA polymerase n=1 Tax=Acidovorax soli TaxID=592050 RepID=A0A1H4ESG3_9BURK|nr:MULTISPECIES: uracil-DNA glycosylase family protein [Acidovorax]SEA88005.1 DNA polymerase [Acidovorax soli]